MTKSERLYEKFVGMDNSIAEINAELGIKGPPFDPFVIAEKLGITVNRDPNTGKKSYSGSITKGKNGSVTIWVDPDDNMNRQRFTVAHEIGHLISGDLNIPGANQFRDNYNTLARSSKRDLLEWRANEFAANLLIPVDEVKKTINEILDERKLKNMKAKEIVPILAKKFAVSKEAMTIRLKILEVIK